jgi:hypothetical protein
MEIFYKALQKKHNIVFVCIDIFNSIKDIYAKELLMNMAEYQISHFTSKGYDMYISNDETVTLKKIVNSYDYAVVFSSDSELEGDNFLNNLHELLKKDFFIAGHVLDRKEAYYELHQQCYVVNLKKYQIYNCPNIGYFEKNKKHVQKKPLRSNENFHHDYTPFWIKPGNDLQEYYHQCHGWNIIKIALDHQENIEIFNENLRNSKRCYYGAYEKDFLEHSEYIYKKYNFCNSRMFYPINTEEIQSIKLEGPIKQLAIPASGFNWVKYLDMYGYNSDTEVLFYDFNPNSLYYMKETVQKFTDGDYESFLKKINKNNTVDWVCNRKEIKDHFLQIRKTYIECVNVVKFKFVQCDLLNEFLLDLLNDQQVILNISNVFSYGPTSFLLSTKQRVYRENKLIAHLQKQHPKINLIASGHAWAGFFDYTVYNDQISKFNQVDIESLQKPLWRSAGDWKN